MQTYALASGVERSSENLIHIASKHISRKDATEITDASAATYTAAQILGGVIIRDPNGAGRTDVLPTAALLLGALSEDVVGQVIECLIVNNADAAETITIDAGTGGTITQIAATRIIPQNTSRKVYIRVDSATAYTAWM